MRARARLRAIRALIPSDPPEPLVDVGADHGHLASLAGAIATERAFHRRGRHDVPWVIADGLTAFRTVGVAIIAGMGAQRISRILAEGPRPAWAIVHAPDDPPTLRRLLAQAGWRIDHEVAVSEGPRVAEIVRLRPGVEPHRGALLRWGPVLSQSAAHSSFLRQHYRRELARLLRIRELRAPLPNEPLTELEEDIDHLARISRAPS